MRSTVERRDRIRQLLNKEGTVRVDKLSEEFGVTAVTIRNDLDFLEKKGILHRTHGGALLRKNVYEDPSLEEKQKLHSREKERIGREAARLINPGESILIDSGSTTLEIARQIREIGIDQLTVMTNAINIALELTGYDGCEVMLTGGTFRRESHSLVGPEAESTLSNYYFDKLFLGVDGLEIGYGLTTPNPMEAELNRMMVRRARHVVAVTDSSKFARHSFSWICDLAEIGTLITDRKISPDYEKELRKREIHLILV